MIKDKRTPRERAISNLARAVNRARIATQIDDLDIAQESLDNQISRITKRYEFYVKRGIIDEKMGYKVSRICLRLENRFYLRYNIAKGFP